MKRLKVDLAGRKSLACHPVIRTSIITSFFRNPIRASVSSLVILIAMAASPVAYGQQFNVGDTSDLNTAISTINSNPNNSYSLNFINGFTLGQSVTAISSNSTITILGNSNTLDAANTFSPLTITSGTVTLQNLNIVNANPEITVNGGTLIGTTFSLQGAISNSGSVQFNQATNGNFGGSVSGGGSVEINSTGFVTFSGTNSYSGGTTVDSGSTLIGTTNSLQNDFSNNGIVRFSQPIGGTYSGNMSGVGSVQINGPGTITFAGSNSYSGGTSINGGSTLVGSTFSLQGGMTNNGLVQFSQNSAGTFGGNMSGSGGVEISGSGAITLAGTNSYSGGTTIDNGSRLIGTTFSLQGVFSNYGMLQFQQLANGTYGGNISGTGGVQISGAGPITFTGLNNYTGGTTVDSGSKLIGTTDSVQGGFVNDGAVQFKQSTSGIYSGNMSGSGNVEISGGGPITFSGANSYSGGTTVDHGNALIGTTDNIQGNFLNSGSVQFNQITVGTYGGNMSGSGSVQISGAGQVTFSGLNNYTGGTTVDANNILIGTTNSLQGAISNSGAIQFSQSSAGSYAGVISGTGSVEIGGTGPVTFVGLNTYSGGTTIDSGSTLLGTTKSVRGLITDNGLLTISQNTSGTVSSTISGTGGLEISGSGPITVTGSVTYTGGTTVDHGSTLIGTTDTLIGNFTDNGTLKVTAGTQGGYNVNTGDLDTAGTLSGAISGTGGVQINGISPVTLTGLNAYSGGTTVSASSKLIGTTDSLVGNFTNSGSLQFTAGTIGGYNTHTGLQDAIGTYSGNISGTGNVEISGVAPITFAGTNTYTGGTTIDQGSRLIGTTSSLQGAITDTGTLNFSQSSGGTYAGVISGTGGVEIGGTGPVTFTGLNTYTGGTTIDNGSSLIGTSISVRGAIVDNGLLTFNQSSSGTVSSAISGTGQITIAGSGPITMSGLTTYTGGTTVNNASTLIGSTDAVIGNITDNGSLKFSAGTLGGYNVNSGLQDVAGTYSGVVTGIGSVEITGTSPVTFSGLNQYTGSTTIDHGSTLVGTTDSVIGNITDSGSLKISEGTQGGYNVVSGLQDLTGTYSGNISGIGHVEISGAGPVTLAGTNTYLGGTTIDSGSSLIGTTNSLQGAIANSGALEFSQSTSGTYSGIISGTGSVEIGGTGAVTFTGSNTYSGGTNVDVGSTLNGTTATLQGSIADNGSVLFNQNAAGTYAGNLSGTGQVEISGTGAVTFTGLNSYSNGTTIDAGSTLIGSTDSLVGNFANSGSLQFSAGTLGGHNVNMNSTDPAGTYSGVISGTGGVDISGNGPVTFSGLNSYTGGTTVDSGATLIGTTDSLIGSFANSGSLVFSAGTQGGYNVNLSSQDTAGTYSGVISGTGGVEISGNGPVTFSGLNTYTGGTKVDTGSTLIGSTDSLQGGFTNNGSVQFNQSTNGTYAGNMSGTGSVEISGSSTLTFSGSNSYSGGTTVDVGNTLIGTTSGLQGDFINSGAVQFSQAAAGTYGGNMSGIGSVEISGVGPLTFAGSNSYTGGTTIDSGSTLIGTTSSLQGLIDNSGALQFNQTTSGTYGDVISGTGSVEINGIGAVTFTGLNSYIGGTTVDTGSTLIGTTSSLQGSITDNGLVNFQQQSSGTFADNISGTGAVQISGGGPITFSGTNRYTGGTTVDFNNSLIGTTDSLQGGFTNNGTVQFNQSTNGTYAGNMSGTGSVEISGSSTLTFSGSNSYSGGTTVDVGNSLFGTTSALQGDIANYGAVQFSQATAGTYGGIMSGTGSVEISGTGPVAFSGLNTYTGGTTVDSGAMLIGTTDSLIGNFANSGNLVFSAGTQGGYIVNLGSRDTAGTYSGVISGTGGVEISGTGPVTFSGLNTYTGGTTVDSGGTLIGTTDSLIGNFANSGSLVFSAGTQGGYNVNTGSSDLAGTYSGVITGMGGVEISGTGPVTFSGLNTYTGGTKVDNGGTLIGSTDSLQGGFTNNGSVQFNQSTNGTYAGNMSGTGSVEISGGSSLTFSGSNSYSGGTTVDVGNGLIGTTSGLQGDFINSGSVQFQQATAGTYGGNMSGAGTVEISGVGPVTFAGTNSYTGGTTVDNGSTLIGTTNSLQGLIANSGALKFNQNLSGTYSGVISGVGTVEIGGTGTVTFSGLNTYTGLTTVDSGSTLIVSTTGALAGSVNVIQGGLFMGEGAVGATTVQAGGTIYPGTVGAPLTINGPFTQSTGSGFTAEISPTSSDKIIVNGTAQINTGTTLSLVVDPGTYSVGTKYQLLTATGGVNGTYTTFVAPAPGQNMMFQQIDLPNEIDLTITSNLSGLAQTANQQSVATALDQASGSSGGGFANAINQLTALAPGQASTALNQLSGDIYPSIGTIERQTTTVELQLLSNRLSNLMSPYATAPTASNQTSHVRFVSQNGSRPIKEIIEDSPEAKLQTWTSWAQGYGLGGNLAGNGNAGGLNYRLGGTLFGTENWISEGTLIGVLGGYAGTSLGDRQAGSTAQINAFQVGLYEHQRFNQFYVSNIDGFSGDNYSVSRPINLGGSALTASGQSSGNQWAHYTEAGAMLGNPYFRYQPFAGVQYMYLDQRGYSESGAGGLDLTVGHQTINSLRSNLGVRLYQDYNWGGVLIIPSISARYQREFGDGAQMISSSFSGTPTVQFATAGNSTGRDFGVLSIGATGYLSDHFNVYMSADAQAANRYTAVMGSGGIQYSW